MTDRWLVSLSLVGMIVVVGSAAALPTRAQEQPHTFRDAVLVVLKEYELPYEDVVVVNGCAPSYQNCRTYAGVVTVVGQRTYAGSIACRSRWSNCTLTLPDAGVRVRLADVVEEPLLDQLRRLVDDVRGRVEAAR